ncbi:MAG TPA: L-histidine N(alpha)-methyltransferase [Alphaproteobacteria bacterium]
MESSVHNLVDLAPTGENFRDAVLAGLSRTPKSIPCKFLYDARGSALFEKICELPEYYPTRTECGILRRAASEIAEHAGPDCQVVEFGSGSSTKTRILLDALRRPSSYVPVDISREQLRAAASALASRYQGLNIIAICADYTADDFVPALPDANGTRLAFFPGSTIGNFEPGEAKRFLARCAHVVGAGGALLIGVDLKKDEGILNAAYNDAAGITAAFNLNLLVRMNRELGASFDVRRFAHDAFYSEAQGRVEIYIRSLERQGVSVAGRSFLFAPGERIHTENSYKYAIGEFQHLAEEAGFRPVRAWTDPQRLFSVHLLRASS